MKYQSMFSSNNALNSKYDVDHFGDTDSELDSEYDEADAEGGQRKDKDRCGHTLYSSCVRILLCYRGIKYPRSICYIPCIYRSTVSRHTVQAIN